MSRTKTVSGSIVVATDPETVYDQVSDVTRMHRWSPENTGALVAEPGVPARVGDWFVGTNRRRGVRWSTGCEIIAAERGRRFAFRVRRYGVGAKPALPVAIATWEYTFEPVPEGTLVTETWTDDRRGWPDLPTLWFDRLVTGHPGFASFQRRNIHRTLTNLKTDLESAD
ncbi:SRPBCC family protein [Nocardia puris]|uniref:Polyketide cyclase/dehydrase/lipid transport protein n=1 Tax=Nocardia puris TaxID=208602 RepID=A0A366DPJ4_9NOCA|nr:SRPBCC family protein [Nocardia puris]RBO91379.1 polyketide cyclase/dehydrase/lipid transport protein [Nocardia puris]